ncbi:hypothetical protein Q5752_000415 [Cryptotrichosporon argae]
MSRYVPPHLRASSPRPDPAFRSSPAGPSTPTSTSSARPFVPRTRQAAHDAPALASPASDLRPSRRNFEAGPETLDAQMNMLSISRSGGDGAQGDALRDPALQQVFKSHLDQRIKLHFRMFPDSEHRVPPSTATDEIESLQSIVLMHRKLREGVSALQRRDPFAVEVYESSVRFAILAGNHGQLQSALYTLVDGVYPAVHVLPTTSCPACGAARRIGDAVTFATKTTPACPFPHANARATTFATIRLLYALVREPGAAFYGTLFNAAYAYVSPQAVEIVAMVAKILAPETFSPTAYWALVHRNDPLMVGTAHVGPALQKDWMYVLAVVGMAADAVRERAWDRLRTAYLQMKLSGVRLQLGLGDDAARAYVAARGARIEGDAVKFR